MRTRAALLIGAMAMVATACASAPAATPAASIPILVGPSSAPPSAPSVAPSVEPSSAVPSVASALPSAPTVAPTESAAPSESATEAPSSAAASATPVPSLDLTDLTKNLSHLTSYVEEFKQTGGKTDLDAKVIIVRAPTLQEELDVVSGKTTQRVIIIGTDTYVDSGAGTFVKNMAPASALQPEFDVFDPGVFLRSFQKAVDFSTVPVAGVETKNGVQAVHFHADSQTSLGPGKPTVPPGAQFDLWMSSDNDYLVALEYTGVPEGTAKVNGSIELTQINDPSLTVKPPV